MHLDRRSDLFGHNLCLRMVHSELRAAKHAQANSPTRVNTQSQFSVLTPLLVSTQVGSKSPLVLLKLTMATVSAVTLAEAIVPAFCPEDVRAVKVE